MIRTRSLAAATSSVAVAAAIAFSSAHAQGEVPVTCTNPFSGTKWQIVINYDRNTVDSFPAKITQAAISWHDDRDMGNYTLERKTGNLTVVVASSTGGYFLNDHCDLPN